MHHFNTWKSKKKMLSKALQKRILSLDNKKQRKESGLFVAEGGKTVLDLLAAGLKADKLIATVAWLEEHHIEPGIEVIEVSNDEMKRISFLQRHGRCLVEHSGMMKCCHL